MGLIRLPPWTYPVGEMRLRGKGDADVAEVGGGVKGTQMWQRWVGPSETPWSPALNQVITKGQLKCPSWAARRQLKRDRQPHSFESVLGLEK